MVQLLRLLNIFRAWRLCLGRRKPNMLKNNITSRKTISSEKAHEEQNKTSAKGKNTLSPPENKPALRKSTPWDGRLMRETPGDDDETAAFHVYSVRRFVRQIFRNIANKDWKSYPVFYEDDDCGDDVVDPRPWKRVEQAQRELGTVRVERINHVGGGDGALVEEGGVSDSPWDNIQFGKFGKKGDSDEQKPAKAWGFGGESKSDDPWLKSAW